MKCLVVIAHPLAESLCHTLARSAVDALTRAGHELRIEDLYATNFSPALTATERASYYSGSFAADAIASHAENLLWAEALVLVFPTWWFSLPAILKGWFDRVWAPGIAYDHASDLGAIKPRLHRLRRVLAITTLGSPWWVDRLVMRRPVRRLLRMALLFTCAPRCRFDMLSLYQAEKPATGAVQSFCARIEQRLGAWS